MGAPVLALYDAADLVEVSDWTVGEVQAGQASAEIEFWLWNNKSGIDADTAVNVAVLVRDSNGEFLETAVVEKWPQAKSNGIKNPDNVPNFTDDLQTSFQGVGAAAFLKIGDLPNNCARKLTFKVVIPADAGELVGLQFDIRITRGDNVKVLPYFFQRAFGDGVVDETVKEVFPALLDTKVGVWTGFAGAAGVYTGTIKRKYWVKCSTGGALGVAKYVCSSDGITYSATEILTSASASTNVTDENDVDLGADIDFRGISGNLAVGDIWTIEVDVIPFAIKDGGGLTAYVGPGDALISNNHTWQNNATTISGLTPSTTTYIFLGADGTFTTSASSADQVDKIIIGSVTTDATSVTATDEFYPLTVMNRELKDDIDTALNASYGSLYEFDEDGIPLEILVAGTYYKLTGVTVGREAGAGYVVGDGANGKLTVGALGEGDYRARFDTSFNADDGTECRAAVFVNDIRKDKLTVLDRISGGAEVFASGFTLVEGTVDSGALADINVAEGNALVINETATTPGFSIEVSFPSKIPPRKIIFWGYYDGNDDVEMQIWNKTTVSWDDLRAATGDFPTATVRYFREFLVTGTLADYEDSGVVKTRIHHPSAGNISHDLVIEKLTMIQAKKSALFAKSNFIPVVEDDVVDLRYTSDKTGAILDIFSYGLDIERIDKS